MAQIQFSLIKKIKIGRPELLLTLHPLCPITSYSCLSSPLNVDTICVSPLITYELSLVSSDLWADIESRLGEIIVAIPEKALAGLSV